MLDLRKYTKTMLFEIYKAAERNEWHPDLGPEPDGFSEMPGYRNILSPFPSKKCKADYTKTISNMVAEIIGPEVLFLMLDRDSGGKHSFKQLISRSVPPGSLFNIVDELFQLFTESGEDADG